MKASSCVLLSVYGSIPFSKKRRASTFPRVNTRWITARRALWSVRRKKKFKGPSKARTALSTWDKMAITLHFFLLSIFPTLPYMTIRDIEEERKKWGNLEKSSETDGEKKAKKQMHNKGKTVGPIKILSRHQSCWSGKCTLQSWPLNALHYECWVLPWWWPDRERERASTSWKPPRPSILETPCPRPSYSAWPLSIGSYWAIIKPTAWKLNNSKIQTDSSSEQCLCFTSWWFNNIHHSLHFPYICSACLRD